MWLYDIAVVSSEANVGSSVLYSVLVVTDYAR